jgi:hypothetical protein
MQGEHMSVGEFWSWFAANAASIASNPENQELIHFLDGQVFSTWPQLAWEIGPDPSNGWYFALSPNLSRKLADLAKEAIQVAPKISGWKFHAARQRKNWDGNFILETEGGVQHLNSAEWRYVLLRHQDGEWELVLVSP